MKCRIVKPPDAPRAIVCGSRGKQERCRYCTHTATRLCDWMFNDEPIQQRLFRAEATRSGTCDRPLCSTHSTSPAPGVDLCPEHAGKYSQSRPKTNPEDA